MRKFSLFLLILTAFACSIFGQSTKPKNFVVTETAFNIERQPISRTGLWMWWMAVFQNPNPDSYCDSPEVTVIARDSSGEVVGTYEKSMSALLLPGGKFAYGDNLEVSSIPTKIEIIPAPCRWRMAPGITSQSLQFPTGKVKILKTEYDCKVQGEITNPFDVHVDNLKGAILLRDKSGKLLGGDVIFIKNLHPKTTKPFMEKLFEGAIPAQYDQVEFFAFPSSLFELKEVVR